MSAELVQQMRAVARELRSRAALLEKAADALASELVVPTNSIFEGSVQKAFFPLQTKRDSLIEYLQIHGPATRKQLIEAGFKNGTIANLLLDHGTFVKTEGKKWGLKAPKVESKKDDHIESSSQVKPTR